MEGPQNKALRMLGSSTLIQRHTNNQTTHSDIYGQFRDRNQSSTQVFGQWEEVRVPGEKQHIQGHNMLRSLH